MTSINKPAAQWTDAELLAWARGEASPSGQASNRTVAKECVTRFGFEATDDIDTIKAYVIAKFVAAADAEAEGEGVDESADELSDELGDEPPADEPDANEGVGEAAETTAPAAPAPQPTPAPEAPVVEESGEPEMPDEVVLVKPTPALLSQANMSREIIENNLASYAKSMAPNVPVSQEQAATKQLMLYRTFQIVLRATGQDFFKNMDLLLAFINAHRQTLFTEARAYREMETVRLPANERKNFERLLNLFIGTAAKETRAMALRQVDLPRTLQGLDADMQQRVTEYYSI